MISKPKSENQPEPNSPERFEHDLRQVWDQFVHLRERGHNLLQKVNEKLYRKEHILNWDEIEKLREQIGEFHDLLVKEQLPDTISEEARSHYQEMISGLYEDYAMLGEWLEEINEGNQRAEIWYIENNYPNTKAELTRLRTVSNPSVSQRTRLKTALDRWAVLNEYTNRLEPKTDPQAIQQANELKKTFEEDSKNLITPLLELYREIEDTPEEELAKEIQAKLEEAIVDNPDLNPQEKTVMWRKVKEVTAQLKYYVDEASNSEIFDKAKSAAKAAGLGAILARSAVAYLTREGLVTIANTINPIVGGAAVGAVTGSTWAFFQSFREETLRMQGIDFARTQIEKDAAELAGKNADELKAMDNLERAKRYIAIQSFLGKNKYQGTAEEKLLVQELINQKIDIDALTNSIEWDSLANEKDKQLKALIEARNSSDLETLLKSPEHAALHAELEKEFGHDKRNWLKVVKATLIGGGAGAISGAVSSAILGQLYEWVGPKIQAILGHKKSGSSPEAELPQPGKSGTGDTPVDAPTRTNSGQEHINQEPGNGPGKAPTTEQPSTSQTPEAPTKPVTPESATKPTVPDASSKNSTSQTTTPETTAKTPAPESTPKNSSTPPVPEKGVTPLLEQKGTTVPGTKVDPEHYVTPEQVGTTANPWHTVRAELESHGIKPTVGELNELVHKICDENDIKIWGEYKPTAAELAPGHTIKWDIDRQPGEPITMGKSIEEFVANHRQKSGTQPVVEQQPKQSHLEPKRIRTPKQEPDSGLRMNNTTTQPFKVRAAGISDIPGFMKNEGATKEAFNLWQAGKIGIETRKAPQEIAGTSSAEKAREVGKVIANAVINGIPGIGLYRIGRRVFEARRGKKAALAPEVPTVPVEEATPTPTPNPDVATPAPPEPADTTILRKDQVPDEIAPIPTLDTNPKPHEPADTIILSRDQAEKVPLVENKTLSDKELAKQAEDIKLGTKRQQEAWVKLTREGKNDILNLVGKGIDAQKAGKIIEKLRSITNWKNPTNENAQELRKVFHMIILAFLGAKLAKEDRDRLATVAAEIRKLNPSLARTAENQAITQLEGDSKTKAIVDKAKGKKIEWKPASGRYLGNFFS